jgi:tetratricopeptide (TPR) repeat protein
MIENMKRQKTMASQENKKRADDLYSLALEKHNKHLHDDALSLINQAISLNPSDTKLWSLKGSALRDLERFSEAESVIRTAIDKNQRNHHAWCLLGIIQKDNGEFEKAADSFKKSLRLRKDVGTYTLLAAAERRFDLISSIKHAQNALELDPEWEEAKAILKSAREALEDNNA